MSVPLVPSPLDYIGRRHFGIYPAIRNSGPNEWMLGAGSWSEVQFVNARTGNDIWIPRQYIGAVSDSSGSLVVGLTQDLELRGETVEPRGKRLIEMPLHPPIANNFRLGREHVGPAHVIGIRLEQPAPSTFHKTPFRLGVCVLFVMALLAAASRI